MNKAIVGGANAARFKPEQSIEFSRSNILTGEDFHTPRKGALTRLTERFIAFMCEKGDPSVY